MFNTLFGIVIGAAASLVVGWYFHRRALRRRIVARLISTTEVFSGVDSTIRRTLQVLYGAQEVVDLFHLEFEVENIGDLALREYFEPLAFKLPAGCKVIDAAIIDRRPASLDVSARVVREENGHEAVEFPLSLLNPRDQFRVKLLIDGHPGPDSLRLTVRAEALASEIRLRPKTQDAAQNESVEHHDKDPEDRLIESITDFTSLVVMGGIIYLIGRFGTHILGVGSALLPEKTIAFWPGDPKLVQWVTGFGVLVGVAMALWVVGEALGKILWILLKLPFRFVRYLAGLPYSKWIGSLMKAFRAARNALYSSAAGSKGDSAG